MSRESCRHCSRMFGFKATRGLASLLGNEQSWHASPTNKSHAKTCLYVNTCNAYIPRLRDLPSYNIQSEMDLATTDEDDNNLPEFFKVYIHHLTLLYTTRKRWS